MDSVKYHSGPPSPALILKHLKRSLSRFMGGTAMGWLACGRHLPPLDTSRRTPIQASPVTVDSMPNLNSSWNREKNKKTRTCRTAAELEKSLPSLWGEWTNWTLFVTIRLLGVCFQASKRLYKRLRPSDVPMDGPSVPISLWVYFFSALCGRIDLKFGRNLHVDLLFQFLLFVFLNSSSNSPFSSSFSSELKLIKKNWTIKLLTFVFWQQRHLFSTTT
jgi:hypothetical protein